MQARALDQRRLASALAEAGFPEPEHEAAVLLAKSRGDVHLLQAWLARRTAGEPLEWIVGSVTFCGLELHIEPGVYVPRPQTEPLAARAAELFANGRLGVDVATGCGAVAALLAQCCPDARVVATEIDPLACRCARRNGAEVYQGHLADAVPAPLKGCFDLVFAVVPYVPTPALQYLPRDVQSYEPIGALDGGKDGLRFLSQLVESGTWLLRAGGSMVLELGGDQDQQLRPLISGCGYEVVQNFVDSDGDVRGVELRLGTRCGPPRRHGGDA